MSGYGDLPGDPDLPPGVTQRMIDEVAGSDEPPEDCCPDETCHDPTCEKLLRSCPSCRQLWHRHSEDRWSTVIAGVCQGCEDELTPRQLTTIMENVAEMVREMRKLPHQHEAERASLAPYSGPVASRADFNPQAHGGYCEIQTCACGAVRKVNVNGQQCEVGPWGEA